MDEHLRAFDVDTGRLLWQSRLPAGGKATQMTYMVDGTQYMIQATGGHAQLGTTLERVMHFEPSVPQNV